MKTQNRCRSTWIKTAFLFVLWITRRLYHSANQKVLTVPCDLSLFALSLTPAENHVYALARLLAPIPHTEDVYIHTLIRILDCTPASSEVLSIGITCTAIE